MTGRSCTRVERVLLGLILAFATVVCVYQAWLYRNCAHADFSVTLLMAKHIAQGRDFPVFFYGQPYLGAIESYGCALLVRLFGCSSFVIACGHGLWILGVLGVVWVWARECGGPRAGLGALLFCSCYWPNPFIKHGGYAATVLFSALTLWLSCRAMIGERAGRAVSWRSYFVLGLCGGLGWWTNQLVVCALVTAFVLLVLVLRWRVLAPRVAVAGLVGFLLGSLPFWIWNLQNRWATWEFTDSFGKTSILRGLHAFFVRGYGGGVGFAGFSTILQAFLALLVLGTIAALLVQRLRKGTEWLHPLTWALFVVVSAAISSGSSYGVTGMYRYLSPQWPVAAVAIGCALTELGPRWCRVGIGVLPVLAVCSGVLQLLLWAGGGVKLPGPDIGDVRATAAVLEREGVRHAYSAREGFGLSFYADEKVEVASMHRGVSYNRYKPYLQNAEMDDHPGVLADCGNISGFLGYGGGLATELALGPTFKTLHCHLTPPGGGRVAVRSDEWSVTSVMDGKSIGGVLTDGDVDSEWGATVSNVECGVEIGLGLPESVCMVRMVARDADAYPVRMRIEGLPAGSNEWQVLGPSGFVTRYYWSGPRPYDAGSRYRLEWRLPGVPVTRLRVVAELSPKGWTYEWRVGELQLFSAAPAQASEESALPALLAYLRENGVRRLYSDRWVANRVQEELGGQIEVVRERHVFPDAALCGDSRMELDAGTAIVVLEPDAPITRAVLARQGVSVRELRVGPWVIWEPAQAVAVPLPLRWYGFGCLAGFGKDYAHELVRSVVDACRAQRDPAAALERLVQASRYSPLALSGADELTAWLKRALPADRLPAIAALESLQLKPDRQVGARFAGGFELEGLTVFPGRVRPGDKVSVVYSWRCTTGADPKAWLVFAHIECAGVRFQDDHPLLAEYGEEDIRNQGSPVRFTERRELRVPENAPAGVYELCVGLHDGKGHRAKVSDFAKIHRRSAVVDALFTVEARPSRP